MARQRATAPAIASRWAALIAAVVCAAARASSPPRSIIAVGIDLGTTNSAACVYDRATREPVPVPNAHGHVLTPSVVSFLPGGAVLVGIDAIAAAETNAHSTYRSIKRLLGRDLSTDGERALANRLLPTKDSLLRGADGVRLSCPALGRELRLEEVSAAILAALVADVLAHVRAAGAGDAAVAAVDADDLRCVITVPAQFDDAQREATQLAARLAGLRHVRLMREPVAAALAFGVMGKALDATDGGSVDGRPERGEALAVVGEEEAERTVLVIDVGAGTTDVSVLGICAGLVQVLATAADGRLGGDDVDDALEAWLLGALPAAGHAAVADAIRAQPALRFAARRALEAAKVELSVRRDALVRLPVGADALSLSESCAAVSVRISRADLDAAAEPILARLKRPIYEAALNAQLTLSGERDGRRAGAFGEGGAGAPARGNGAARARRGAVGASGRSGGGQKQVGGRSSEPSPGDMARTSEGEFERSRALPTGRPLDALVMVGGMSKMLGVRKLAANLAGVDVRRTVDPMEAVARGAALQAAVVEGLATGLAVEDSWQAQLRLAYAKLERELAAREARAAEGRRPSG
ncbi:hypothetical protein KFE25_001548 [Diacronema lutheri]|uniref:Uncharacterized protein n=2 Tax=Diacronema lutheri TaxID=2081491 RepID=A0A8J6C4E9_DIALT|nr:hypothetical protein KFE25_001548 [Diacronema lutheri]